MNRRFSFVWFFGMALTVLLLAGAARADCGNGKCKGWENCQTCPQDCGLCQSCGDEQCGEGETCENCPFDCGVCSTCGDDQNRCDVDETCESCPEDCGECGTTLCTPDLQVAGLCCTIESVEAGHCHSY